MSNPLVSANLTAQNTFSDVLAVQAGDTVAVSASGVGSNTVTLQRKIDGSNWRDVGSFTEDTETGYECDCSQELQIGIKTGDYSSGTVAVALRKPQ